MWGYVEKCKWIYFRKKKYCRWSHTDKKKKTIFVVGVYLCDEDICRCFCGECFVVYSSCHIFMTSKPWRIMWRFIISFCKVYNQTVMIPGSLFSPCLQKRFWICFHIMGLCILLKICWIKISKLRGLSFLFFCPNERLHEARLFLILVQLNAFAGALVESLTLLAARSTVVEINRTKGTETKRSWTFNLNAI